MVKTMGQKGIKITVVKERNRKCPSMCETLSTGPSGSYRGGDNNLGKKMGRNRSRGGSWIRSGTEKKGSLLSFGGVVAKEERAYLQESIYGKGKRRLGARERKHQQWDRGWTDRSVRNERGRGGGKMGGRHSRSGVKDMGL